MLRQWLGLIKDTQAVAGLDNPITDAQAVAGPDNGCSGLYRLKRTSSRPMKVNHGFMRLL